MKKFLFAVGVLMISCSFASVSKADRDCTKDYAYDRQQSLVIYHYKDETGKKVDKTYGAWKDVPDNLKKMCWECWVDNLGWYNCKEMDPKNAPAQEPAHLPPPKNPPTSQPAK